jgi:hypothetical protein
MPATRVLFAAILTAALLPASLPAQTAADLAGAWQLTLETPRGEQSFAVEITRQDEQLGGTLVLPRGDTTELKEITFEENVLSFAAELGMGRRGITMRFEGRLEDGVVTGEMQPDGAPARARGGRSGGGTGQGPGPRPFTMVRAGG